MSNTDIRRRKERFHTEPTRGTWTDEDRRDGREGSGTIPLRARTPFLIRGSIGWRVGSVGVRRAHPTNFRVEEDRASSRKRPDAVARGFARVAAFRGPVGSIHERWETDPNHAISQEMTHVEVNGPIPWKNDHPPTRRNDLLFDDPTRKPSFDLFVFSWMQFAS